MYAKGTRKGTVRFSLRTAGSVKKVQVCGDFGGWEPVDMKMQKDGSFAAIVALPAGACEYKFLVDGEWVVDPDNSTWSLNPYGTLNSIANVQ